MSGNQTSAHRARRSFGMVVAILGLVFVAWRIISLGVADRYARSDPDRALRWRPDHALALAVRAERYAQSLQWNLAQVSARAALVSNPLESRAFRVLAQHADALGDTKKAFDLYAITVSHRPRDLISQRWLFNHHVLAGSFESALPHLDAMFRAKPELMASLSEQLSMMATLEQTQPAFARLLSARPPWRDPALNQILRVSKDIDGLSRLLQLLSAAPGGLESAFLGRWIDRLIQERRFADAYVQWVGLLPDNQQERIANVFNGDFEWPLLNAGFDWRIDPVEGAHVDVVPTENPRSGHALRISFDDRRVPFQHVRQWLLLSPGAWRLKGRVRADDLRTERGLVWEVRCVGSGAELAQSEPLRGAFAWQWFNTDFDVPGEGCDTQELVLSIPARISSEQHIGGVAWFDDILINRRPL